ncbi:hypothetical protein [Qipengyuania sp.]|uniref:hypothetical protein n=1 Tax=Qipengyuania sp. TaxID=2004515 RepID=UPI0035C7E68F
MSTTRRAEMIADLHLRDAARELVRADIRNIKADLRARGVGARAMDRLAEGASDVYDEAMDVAADNKGALAAILAAVVLWFARNPILQAVGLQEEDADEAEQEGHGIRSIF